MSGDIIQAVRTLLLGGDVASITDQIYSDHIPQGIQAPAVVMWTISGVAEDCLRGFTGFETATLQIECHGRDRSQAQQLWRKVNKTLSGYRGKVDDTHIVSVGQGSGHRQREDRPLKATDQYRYVTMQDFEFSYHVYEADL